jgi:hypothetical protein
MTGSQSERYTMRDVRAQTPADEAFSTGMEAYFGTSPGTNMDRLRNFTKFVPRQNLSIFLAKHALFEKILGVHGHILECGVFLGGGLTTWAQLSAIYEPYNHVRRIVGFDTFSGFPTIHSKDREGELEFSVAGGLAAHVREDLQECLRLYDLNRPIGHIPRVELVVGDALTTIPRFVETNPHLVVAMLYLDFDLYEPTKAALEAFLPRMPKGSLIVFDELNQSAWPGETLAVMEAIGLRNLRIERFTFTPQLSFAVLE